MTIITDEFIELFKNYPIRSQEKETDPKVNDIAGSATWFLTEFDSKEKIAFGYVVGLDFDEWGQVFIPELESIHCNGIPRIERDLYFEPKPISECLDRLKGE